MMPAHVRLLTGSTGSTASFLDCLAAALQDLLRRHTPPQALQMSRSGQRVVGSGVSDGRRRLSMLLAAACGVGRGSRESCRGSQRSPGGRPLVCAMCVSPLLMSCAHVRRCLIYLHV